MKKFKLETTTIFNDLVEEYTLNGISDLDVTEELRRHEETIEANGKIETWDWENGILEIYIED